MRCNFNKWTLKDAYQDGRLSGGCIEGKFGSMTEESSHGCWDQC